MAWSKEFYDSVKKIKSVEKYLKAIFTQRDTAIELLALAIICRENVLFLGPPGTAKTELVSRYSELLDLKSFHYLLTRFTEPTEIYGPMDMEAFKKGEYVVKTDRMLPEAHIVFLDEVFQGSSAILNSLLTILNERIFFNGSQRQALPLITIIGASNSLPEDTILHAFADRFLLRLELESIQDEFLDELMERGWDLELPRIKQATGQVISRELPRLSALEIQKLHGCVAEVNLSRIRPEYARFIKDLRAEGLELSDRRIVKTLKLIAGAALLRGSDTAEVADFWPLFHVWNRFDDQSIIRNQLMPRLAEAGVDIKKDLRTVKEILIDLDMLNHKESDILSSAARASHLSELAKIRREVINDHPHEKDVLKKVEEAINRGLKKMEANHV